MQNRSVPSDTVVPHVTYRDLLAARAWLRSAFGFREAFRYGDPLSGIQMLLANACIMITQATETRPPGTPFFTVILEDVDTHYRRSVQHGAKIVEDLHVTVYGERQYAAEDLEGNRWLFAQHARDLAPEEWGADISHRDD
jgi:uncharacterized glyoxalase superfamily protein PhnB